MERPAAGNGGFSKDVQISSPSPGTYRISALGAAKPQNVMMLISDEVNEVMLISNEVMA